MVFPAVLAGAGLAVSSLYSAGQAYDNVRYWDEYRKRTGVRIKYPFRSGSYDYMKYAGKTMMSPYAMYKYCRW